MIRLLNLLAVMGLAADIDGDRPARVVAATVNAVSPASGGDDALVDALAGGSEEAGELALFFGLLFAALSMTTAMAQIERGSNRIYGIRRDRPALHKYGRAAAFTLVLAVPVGLGFLVLVAGGAFGDAMVQEYGWSDGVHTAWQWGRWPLGLLVLVFTIAVLFDHAPRRRQPALSWLALGSGITVALSMTAAAGLAAYTNISGSFSSSYGPLAGIVALLLWSLLSSISLFFGVAVCAQLEALRAGQTEPAYDDPGRPHHQQVGDAA